MPLEDDASDDDDHDGDASDTGDGGDAGDPGDETGDDGEGQDDVPTNPSPAIFPIASARVKGGASLHWPITDLEQTPLKQFGSKYAVPKTTSSAEPPLPPVSDEVEH